MDNDIESAIQGISDDSARRSGGSYSSYVKFFIDSFNYLYPEGSNLRKAALDIAMDKFTFMSSYNLTKTDDQI